MPQDVTLYRMLVASPGDCIEERKTIPKLVADWNAAHSIEASIVIESVLWETHAQPEIGERPQAILNRQIVDACDFVVGVCWTRLGTPTGTATSGTSEEVERFRAKGKRVLLYFSNAPVAPDMLDLAQYSGLREYQGAMRATGLVFTYEGIHDFERLFSRHLAHLMASLTGPQTHSTSETLIRSLAEDANLHLSDRAVFDALHTLKQQTRFFWPELTELTPFRDTYRHGAFSTVG